MLAKAPIYTENIYGTGIMHACKYDYPVWRIMKADNGTGAMDCTTHYYLSGNSVVEERNGSGGLMEQFVHGLTYVDELVQLGIASDPPSATTCDTYFWVCQDANFNVLGVVYFDGTATSLIERYEYSAYGQRQIYAAAGDNDPGCYDPIDSSSSWNSLGTPLNEFGHQGLMHDEETGLVYNRARFLHPTLGRFMQQDPLGYVDGMNQYEYVRSNPIHYSDSSGMYSEDIHFYMTLYLAFRCGLTNFDSGWKLPGGYGVNEGLLLAWADNYTDVAKYTKPVGLREARAVWHFRSPPAGEEGFGTRSGSSEPRTVRDTPFARLPLQTGIDNNNLLQIGMGMHAFQDSWSHDGYGPELGHGADGTQPDDPFGKRRHDGQDQLEMAVAMARRSYEALDAIMKKRHNCGCKASWPDVEKRLRDIFALTKGNEDSKARSRIWQTQMSGEMHWSPDKDFVNDMWEPIFTDQARNLTSQIGEAY
jgi:RHS repeat-associated protein